MTSPIKVAEYLVAFYQLKDKRKELFVENVGKIWRFSSTEDFIEQNTVIGIKDWSKKEQNVFVHLLKDNPYKQLIIDEYNRGVTQYDNMKEKGSTFKKIASISEFLKAPPYNKGDFAENVIKKCVEWGFDGDDKSLDLMKKSLSLYADKHTINDFISEDSEKKKNGFDLLKGITLADRTKEMNGTTLLGFAAIASLALPGMHKLIHAGAMEGLSKASELVGKTGAFGQNIVDMFHQHPSMTTFAVVAASSYIAYKGFQELHKVAKEFYSKEKEKYVAGVKVKDLDTLSPVSVLSQKILGKIIRENPFDATNYENQKYVSLCCFAVDKLTTPSLEVPKQMVDDFKLTQKQVDKLNKLTEDDIHELALINNPIARKALLIGELNEDQKNTLKTISLVQDIGNIKSSPNGKSFKSIGEIKNISQEIKENVSKRTESEQMVLQAYMNLYTNESGNCLGSVLKSVHGALKTQKPIENQILAETKIDYENMPPEIPRNEELAYFKRVWNWFTSKEKRVENTVNTQTKELIHQISAKYNFTRSQETNNFNPTLVNGLKNIGVEMKDGVLDKINKLREKVSSPQNSSSVTPRHI